MSKLKVDIDNLKSASKTLKQSKKDLKQVDKKLNELLKELDETWDGAASAEFIARLRTEISEMNKAIEAVDGIQKYSNNTAETMEKIDSIINALRKFL